MVVSEVLNNHLGVTKPLSLAGPSEADLIRNKELEKVCSFRFLNYVYMCVFLCNWTQSRTHKRAYCWRHRVAVTKG